MRGWGEELLATRDAAAGPRCRLALVWARDPTIDNSPAVAHSQITREKREEPKNRMLANTRPITDRKRGRSIRNQEAYRRSD